MAVELIHRLETSGFKGHTLTLKIKFHDFSQKTRSASVAYELKTLKEILPLAKKLLRELELTQFRIRLIGLSVSNPFEATSIEGPLQLRFDFD